MPRLTVCCPLAAIDCPNDDFFRKKVYDEVTKKVDKETIKSISFYPENWANKLRITFREGQEDLKNEVIIEGLCLFGKSVSFEDEGGIMQRIVVTDAHPEWDLEVLKSVFCEYADIARCEREFYYEDGQRTIIETGKIFIYATQIRKQIPRRVTIMAENSLHQVGVWYRQQNSPGMGGIPSAACVRCAYCGKDHRAEDCEHQRMVCYLCQESGHDARGCPNNQGCLKDESAFIFYNGKCPLSNWSMEYTFSVGTTEYSCVEQYVMEEKAYNFGDSATAAAIRDATTPRAMKNLGKRIRNYDHQEWLGMVEAVTLKALEAKFNDTAARGAREFLLETGERRIGEASTDQYWGTGVHHLDPKALSNWTGRNVMGNMLMEVRRRILRQVSEESTESEKSSDEGSIACSENESENESHSGNSTLEADLSNMSVPGSSFMALPTPGQGKISSTPKVKRKKKKANKNSEVKRPKWVVSLGDSNLPKLIERPDETIPAKIMCVSKPGMKLNEARIHAEKCMVPKEDVDLVLVHLGTCAWHYEADISTADVVYKDFEKMFSEVSTVFTNARLAVSGIIPRNTTGEHAEKAKLMNEEKGECNKKLSMLEEEGGNVFYISNDNILTDDQGGNHFVDDTVHLNQAGRDVLLGNLKDGIRRCLRSGTDWSTIKPFSGK